MTKLNEITYSFQIDQLQKGEWVELTKGSSLGLGVTRARLHEKTPERYSFITHDAQDSTKLISIQANRTAMEPSRAEPGKLNISRKTIRFGRKEDPDYEFYSDFLGISS